MYVCNYVHGIFQSFSLGQPSQKSMEAKKKAIILQSTEATEDN